MRSNTRAKIAMSFKLFPTSDLNDLQNSASPRRETLRRVRWNGKTGNDEGLSTKAGERYLVNIGQSEPACANLHTGCRSSLLLFPPGLGKFKGDGQNGDDDDAEDDEFHVLFDGLEPAEEKSGAHEKADP